MQFGTSPEREAREKDRMSSDRILEWQRQAAAEGAPGLNPSSSPDDFAFTDGDATTLESLRRDQAEFARERDWDKFHTPRNVLMAMVGEVGELSEIFQWRGDEGCAPGLPLWSEEDKTHLGEEMADVLLYLVRLADRCKVDLPAAAKRKLERLGVGLGDASAVLYYCTPFFFYLVINHEYLLLWLLSNSGGVSVLVVLRRTNMNEQNNNPRSSFISHLSLSLSSFRTPRGKPLRCARFSTGMMEMCNMKYRKYI